jgi:ABC-2 type transport system permease protein
VISVASLLYGVQFNVEQWATLLTVFFLTLAALYGLGMVLASLFLVWGREAWHMGQLLTEPVYFISGLNFPVARLGMLGALSVALIPLATGLDAMRQLAFAGAAFPAGTPSPLVEIGILVVMSIGSILAARWMLLAMERRARRDGRLSVRWQ